MGSLRPSRSSRYDSSAWDLHGRPDQHPNGGPTIPIPARDDTVEFPDVSRADRFFSSLEKHDIYVAGKRVADLGTGYGFLALASARRGASSVVAVDGNAKRLEEVSRRVERAGLDVETVTANLLEPLTSVPPVDIAFLIGVVEYAGLWADGPPGRIQERVFRVAHDVIAPGGTLVFASKNRLWPRYAAYDAHTLLPLVNVLPRGVADSFTRWRTGYPYRHHIQTPGGWEKLIRSAGFSTVTRYYPYFSYQFPVALERRLSLRSVGDIARLRLSSQEREAALGSRWRQKALLMGLAGSLGLPLSHSVILVATR